MQPRSPIISEHRLARFVTWLGCVLLWLAIGEPRTTRAHKRHHKRFGHLSAGVLIRAVRNLIVIRAAHFMQESAPPPQRRNFAPAGFTRRIIARATPRAIAGAWLRRRLKIRGSFVEQAAHLIEALKHLRGLAACLAWRRRGLLTRLCAVVLVRPQQSRLRALVERAPPAKDSS